MWTRAEPVPADRVGSGDPRAAAWDPLGASGRAHIWIFAGLLLASAVVRWELLAERSLWFDEGYSLFVSRLGWRGILEFLRVNDAHPAGYYLLLAAWRHLFGDDLAVARLPSLVSGVGSVGVTWALARGWWGPWPAHLAAALAAFNAFQVYASNEVRMYMPLQLVTVLATAALDRAVQRGGRWWAAYGILCALAGYLSYFALFAFLPQAVWVLWRRDREASRGLAVAGFVGLLLYAPWLPYLPGFTARNPQLFSVRPAVELPGLPTYVASVLASHTFGGYLPNTVTYHRSSLLLGPYLPALAPFVVLALVGAWNSRRRPGSLAPTTWLGGVALASALSVAMGVEVAYPRNLVFLQPLAAVTVAAGAAAVTQRLPGRLGALAGTAAAVLLAIPTWTALENLQSGRPEFDAYRYDRAGRYVAANFREGDLLVYFPKGVEYAFGYYFRRPARSLILTARADLWDRPHLRELFASAEPHLRGARRVWLVTSFPRPELLSDLFRTVARAGYVRVRGADFMGVQVQLYQRRERRPAR